MDADEILKRDAELRKRGATKIKYIDERSDSLSPGIVYLANIAAAERALIEAAKEELANDPHADPCLDPTCIAYRALLAAMEAAQQ